VSLSLRERLPTARRHALLLALAVAGLVLLVASEELHGLLVGALPAAETLIRRQPVLGALAIVGFSALSAMLAFVSSALIVPVAVYVWGAPRSMLLIWVGWTLGGALSYALARRFGRQVAHAIVGAAALEPFEHTLSRRASFGLVLLVQAAMPSEVPGYLLRLLRYPFWKYLLALSIAELPYAAATVWLGQGFVDRRTWLLVGVGTGMAVFSGWMLWTLRRQLLHMSSRAG
jgi:uncharacterized membrane protein YdjX (TVP38/TMEM64 family)